MKNNYYLKEIGISGVLIIILLFCLNPFELLMPPPFIKLLIIILLLIFGIFSAIIWKERSGDERDNSHKMIAGHFAFLTGSILLVIAIAIQEISHTLDPWLVYILIGMILAKIIGHIYSQKKF